MTTTYTATAVREGRWWVLSVEGIGVTQARNLREAPEQARGMIAAMLDVDDAEVHVDVVPELDAAILEDVRTAKDAAEDARIRQIEAAHQARVAAGRLERAGLTRADVATVLKVSPQRVSQLLEPLDRSEAGALRAKRRKDTRALSS